MAFVENVMKYENPELYLAAEQHVVRVEVGKLRILVHGTRRWEMSN